MASLTTQAINSTLNSTNINSTNVELCESWKCESLKFNLSIFSSLLFFCGGFFLGIFIHKFYSAQINKLWKDIIRQLSISKKFTSDQCIICYDKPPDVILKPCNHKRICTRCCTELVLQAKKQGQITKCPECRTDIDHFKVE